MNIFVSDRVIIENAVENLVDDEINMASQLCAIILLIKMFIAPLLHMFKNGNEALS